MGYKLRNFQKILGINFFVTGVILLITELILGKYFLSSAAYNIPETLVNHSESFDVTNIEMAENKITSKYTTDINGYRPYEIPKSGNELILTIGGSTTDQLHIDDTKTWQALMEKSGNRSVINAGVDGQSSFGHLLAIKKWHSEVLKDKKVDKVLFYIGVNDVRFSKSLDPTKNPADSPSLLRKFRAFLSRRSFLYSKLRQAKAKFNIIRGVKLISPDGVIVAGYGTQNPPFLDNPIETNINLSNKEASKEYRELFKNLMLTTADIFKNSKIYVVQQQDPKCLITNKKVFARTTQSGIKEYCSALASIFKTQEQTLQDMKNPNINLIQMYKDNPIPDQGFYDGIHTNSLGSEIISKYLLNKLRKDF